MQRQYCHEYTPSLRPAYPSAHLPWSPPFVYSPLPQGLPLSPETPRVRSAKQAYNRARANAKAAEARLSAAESEAAARPTYPPYPAYVYATPGYAHVPPPVSPVVSYDNPMAAGHVILNNPQNYNIYHTPGPGYVTLPTGSPLVTPVPSYISLSPPAPPYMEPGTPGDIPMDKWENGKQGFLYDNRKSPVEVNSCHSVLEVHPVLSHGSDFPLIMDLCLRREDVTPVESQGTRWWLSDEGKTLRSQPAVLPRITRLRLGSSKLRHFVDVVNPRGVTVCSD